MSDHLPLSLNLFEHKVDLEAQLKLFTEQRTAAPMLLVEFDNECIVRLAYGKGLFGVDERVGEVDFIAKRRSINEIACASFASVAEVWNATEIMDFEPGQESAVRFPKKHAGLPWGDFSSGRPLTGVPYPRRITIACDLKNMASFLDCARATLAALKAQLGEPLATDFLLQTMGEENRKKMVAHSLTISDHWDMEFFGHYAEGFNPFEVIPELSHPRIFPVVVAEFIDQTNGRFDQVLDMQINVRHRPNQPIDLLLHSSHDFAFMQKIAHNAGLEVEQLPDRFPDGPRR